ncbi:MAG: hypothetical protein CSA66_06645 [Proteobacteria bacterium]|nr:MAG: hypothetical protein CSA66_06645 [Pseudomonadota bacterium]
MNVFLRAGVALASVLLAGVALAAPAVDQVDSFTAGDAAGWSTGGDNVGAVADAGPAGDGDAALEVVSDGSGQGGHIAVFNQAARWTGDWAAAGVSQLRVDLKNTSAVPLAVRIKLERGPAMETDYVVSAAQTVPADGAWSSYTFDVGVAGLSGPADPASALANVVRLWIQHDPDGIHPPDAQAGALLIDNITALGGTCGDGLKGPDELCDGDDVGAAACADLPGFDGGVLSCDASSDCEAYDTSLCTSCGDGVCEAAETAATCPDDCTTCGDGLCTGEETPASCPADCAAVCGDGFVSGDEECDWGTAGALRDVFASSPLLLSLGGLAVHAGDAIAYLSDPAQEVIHRIDAVTGAFIDSAPFIDTLGGAPVDVGISPDGDLFVISKANNRVEAYDRGDGSYISAFPLGGGLTRPEAIAFMPERSRVFVASDRDDAGLLQPIKQMDLVTGLMIGDFGAAVGDNDVAFGPGGDLFTVQGATIARYDGEDGTELGTWIDASATLDEILRFTFIADGRVFVLGPAGGEPTLVKYDASGQLVGVFGAGAVGPGAGLAVGPGGRLLGPGVDPSPDRVVAVARFETGNSDDTADSCREDCRDPRCGDGAVDSGEACDDGDDDDGDGCSGCSLDAGWVCDTAIVPNTCAQTCGDAALDAHEACDDGNAVDGDGCTASCAVEVGWACTAPSGGVGSSCAAEACGDGVIAGDEECEDGDAVPGDGCTGCEIDDGWVCDAATLPSPCWPTCGDGSLGAFEACDDTNTQDGDGCSANCVIEAGWTCADAQCHATECGDGVAVADEECDDANTAAGDGCDDCALEDGWVCEILATPSACADTCGDGVADPLEACDDANAVGGDGCSADL